VLQTLREKCQQLEEDVHMLSDKLKQAQNMIAEKDCYIEVCDVTFVIQLCVVNNFCWQRSTISCVCLCVCLYCSCTNF